MLDYIGPYHCLTLIIFVFILLWFFYGRLDTPYEFVGLNPLYPEYELGEETTVESPIHDFINASVPKVVNEEEQSVHMKEEIEMTDLDLILPEKADPNCNIDLTPEVPVDFLDTMCYVRSNTGYFESRPEQLCRKILESIYGVKFIKARPHFLKNPETNRNLELDVYNPDLKIALEYNGEFHYKWGNNAKMSYIEFKNQIKRDQLKKKLCEENGIHLIVVPYVVSLKSIPLYIIYHLPANVRERVIESKMFDEYK